MVDYVKNPHPFVYWAQNKSHILLRVDLKDVKDPDVQVNHNCIKLAATGVGARGVLPYEFELELAGSISPMESQYRVTARQIDVSLKKETNEWWPRILHSNVKPSWLKVDFDRWKSEDDEAGVDASSNEYSELNSLDNLVKTKEPLTFNLENLRRNYLFVYNLWQFLGFLYIFSRLLWHYMNKGTDSLPEAYPVVQQALKFCQLMQFLEILHPIFGYTKGSLFEPIVQVGGRAVILFCLVETETRIQDKPVVFYLVACWSLIEVFRYPYYMTRVFDKDIGFITWLRYTMWIPLYPLGFLCEGVVILRNIPYFEETERYSVSLPNSWNFSFHFPTLMRMYLLFFFLPAMYVMMSHMQRLRNQKLGLSASDKRAKTSSRSKVD